VDAPDLRNIALGNRPEVGSHRRVSPEPWLHSAKGCHTISRPIGLQQHWFPTPAHTLGPMTRAAQTAGLHVQNFLHKLNQVKAQSGGHDILSVCTNVSTPKIGQRISARFSTHYIQLTNSLTPWGTVPIQTLHLLSCSTNTLHFMEPDYSVPRHKRLKLVPILSHANSVYNFPSCSYKIHFNIILQSTTILLRVVVSFVSSEKQ